MCSRKHLGLIHGATSQRRREIRLYQAAGAERRTRSRLSTWKFECDELCREAIAPVDGDIEEETGKLFAFDLALERAALRRRGTRATEARRKDRSGKVCFKKLEKRDRNNAIVVQRAIKILSHSQHVSFP